jgi:large subunit ribosomal protein L14e
MFDIGRVCMKLAGRDAGKMCVVVQVIDARTVLIDGQTRRRKCSVTHLEPTDKTVEISTDASNQDVVKALATIGIECVPKKSVEIVEATEEKAPVKKKSAAPKRKATKKKEAPAKKSKTKAKK